MASKAADEIRKELKKRGISSRKVGVRQRWAGYSESITLTIKDYSISESEMKEVGDIVRNVSYDASGEVLMGGNTYVFVKMADNLMDTISEDEIQAAQEMIDDIRWRGTDYIKSLDEENKIMLYQWKNDPNSIIADCAFYGRETSIYITEKYMTYNAKSLADALKRWKANDAYLTKYTESLKAGKEAA